MPMYRRRRQPGDTLQARGGVLFAIMLL